MSGAKALNHIPPPTLCGRCRTMHSIAERCPTSEPDLGETRQARETLRMLPIMMRLPDAEALALAQFVKRVGWSEIRANSVDTEEAYVIRAAIYKLQTALAEYGFAPR